MEVKDGGPWKLQMEDNGCQKVVLYSFKVLVLSNFQELCKAHVNFDLNKITRMRRYSSSEFNKGMGGKRCAV